MKLVRFLANLVLAVLVILLTGAILLTVGGLALARTWEEQGLDHGALENGLWMWLDGEPIYYLEWSGESADTQGAERPTIVLVHDLNAQGSATWLGNGHDLARRGNRVLAIDLRGMGHSTREGSAADYTVEEQALLLAKVLNELQVQGATVVSHGWGALVALRLAEEQPQFVRHLVLISPYGDSEYLRAWRTACRWPYSGRAASWFMLSGGPIDHYRQRQAMLTTKNLPEGYWNLAARPSHILGTVDALVATATSWGETALAAPRSIQAPITVVSGEGDTLVPPAQAGDLADALKGQFILIPEAGHYPQLEQPAALNRVLDEVAQRAP